MEYDLDAILADLEAGKNSRGLNALPSLIRDLREAGELLREVEWVHVDGVTFCPSCLNNEYEAHAPGCKLDALLRKMGG